MKIIDDPILPYCVKAAIIKQAEIYSGSVAEHLGGVGEFDAQFSVTTLNKSPRQNHLYRRHAAEIVVSPWDRLHLLDGSIFHYLLESHPQPGGIVERRFGVMVNYQGKKIYFHGAADLFIPDSGHLIDFKRSSVQKLLPPADLSDYEFQLNALRWIIINQKDHMYDKSGKRQYEVKRLSNFFSLKDWKKREAFKSTSYPKKPMIWIDYPIWTDERIKSEVFSRLRRHFDAAKLKDDDLPECTNEERWKRDSYRVFGNKKDGSESKLSKGTFRKNEEATAMANEIGGRVVPIPGRPTKCIDFCDCSIFCNQRQREIQQQNQTTEYEDETD